MLIEQLHTDFNLPVAVVCRRFDIPRTSFYHKSTSDDSELLERIKDIASRHSAWGYRMIWADLRGQGIKANHKKVYRLYCEAGLQKPPMVSGEKHHRVTQPFEATEASFPGHVWAGDFLHDRISTGRAFRIFNILDIFTRRGFEPPVEHSLPGMTVARHLDSLCEQYGPPRGF